jgi:hypothetical protein
LETCERKTLGDRLDRKGAMEMFRDGAERRMVRIDDRSRQPAGYFSAGSVTPVDGTGSLSRSGQRNMQSFRSMLHSSRQGGEFVGHMPKQSPSLAPQIS